MWRLAPQARYERHLQAQDPHERAHTLGWFPTCRYNTGNCGALCSIRANGRPYSMCDYHRQRHASAQRRSSRNRRDRQIMLAVMDAHEGVDLAAMNVNDDSNALMTDEQLFGAYWAALLIPTTAFDVIHDENDDIAVDDECMPDIIDRVLDAVEIPVVPVQNTIG